MKEKVNAETAIKVNQTKSGESKIVLKLPSQAKDEGELRIGKVHSAQHTIDTKQIQI